MTGAPRSLPLEGRVAGRRLAGWGNLHRHALFFEIEERRELARQPHPARFASRPLPEGEGEVSDDPLLAWLALQLDDEPEFVADCASVRDVGAHHATDDSFAALDVTFDALEPIY